VVDNPTALCYNYYISKETNKQLRKRNKMKNIVSILAVVAATATASGAAANAPLEDQATVIWSGSVADLADGCMFTKNESGLMSYTENSTDAGGVWEVTKRAKLNVSVRGKMTSLSIKADEHIVRQDNNSSDSNLTTNSHVKYSVNVDYTAGAFPTQIKRSYNVVDEDFKMQAVTDAEYTTGVNGTAAKIDMLSHVVGKHNEIKLGGTATMNYSGALIDNGEYTLGHTATCVQ
jgi:hypothetical protein